MSINVKNLVEIINNISLAIEENKQYLTDLDAAIGDADHGINMNKGFQGVKAKLSGVDFKDAAEVLKVTGMTLVSTVGGASGPLYGTAFMKAATKGPGKEEIFLTDFYEMLKVAIEGIKLRGKSELGDKTMLDVLIPVQDSIKESIDKEESSKEALRAALAVAEKALEGKKKIAARIGRAIYLGERSIGHEDPGATSSYLMIRCISQYLEKKEI